MRVKSTATEFIHNKELNKEVKTKDHVQNLFIRSQLFDVAFILLRDNIQLNSCLQPVIS